MAPAATIVITTRNRRDDLREALCTALAQTADIEVLVLDDASDDDTAEMVVREFPAVRLERFDAPQGYIVLRNAAARIAAAPVIVSMDDDARLRSPATVGRTLADFDHPRIGAVAIPYTDRFPGLDVPRQRPPQRPGRWIVETYVGTAHAIRRDLFLALGGYREELRHMTEERDLCLRMLEAGYVVRLGSAEPLDHLLASRDQRRNVVMTRRNDVLHALNNVPLPYLPVRLAKVLAESGRLAIAWRAPGLVAQGTLAGFRGGVRRLRERQPVSRRAYRVDHALRRRGPIELGELEPSLPPPRTPDAPVPEPVAAA